MVPAQCEEAVPDESEYPDEQLVLGMIKARTRAKTPTIADPTPSLKSGRRVSRTTLRINGGLIERW